MRTDVPSTLAAESAKSELLTNQHPKNEIKRDILSLKNTSKLDNQTEECQNDCSIKSECIASSKKSFFQVRCRSKSETKLSSLNEIQNFDVQKEKFACKLTPWWTRIDTLSINEKRQILRTHSFGTIAKVEDPELCCLSKNSKNPTPPCLVMLFGCPQVGKSTTINTFKKAFHGDTNYVEYAPVGDGISGYKTQSVQFYKLGKMQLGDSRGQFIFFYGRKFFSQYSKFVIEKNGFFLNVTSVYL
jgi:ribosome biogenesis GTPase A